MAGLARYVLATVRELRSMPGWGLEVLLDGHPVYRGDALLASTLNTCTYGGGIPAAPGASMHDGRLDLLLAARVSRAAAVRLLLQMLQARHGKSDQVQQHSFSRMQLKSSEAVPLAADGEHLGMVCEVSVDVLPRALQVVYGPDAAA